MRTLLKKDGPYEIVEKVSASVKIAEAYRATLAPITTRATFPRVAEAFFQTKETYLKQLYVRQHEVVLPLNAGYTDRITSAEKTDSQRANCAVQVDF